MRRIKRFTNRDITFLYNPLGRFNYVNHENLINGLSLIYNRVYKDRQGEFLLINFIENKCYTTVINNITNNCRYCDLYKNKLQEICDIYKYYPIHCTNTISYH